MGPVPPTTPYLAMEQATLTTFAVNEPVSCIYAPEDGNFVAVGNASGALRLFFEENGGYRYVTLARKSVEGIRCMHFCAQEGALYVGTGDRGVYKYDLNDLQPDTEEPGNAVCEKVRYDRVHSYGTCSHSFVLHHGKLFVLVLVGALTAYTIDFDKMVKHEPEKGRTDEHAEGLVPEQQALEHRVSAETTPCCFNGEVLVSITHSRKRTWTLSVMDWNDNRKVVRDIPLHLYGKNALRPSHVSLLNGVVGAVLNEHTIKIWDIASGDMVTSFTSPGKVVALVLIASPEALSPLVVLLSKRGAMRVYWKGEEVRCEQLDKSRAHFDLNLVYILQCQVAWSGENVEFKKVFYSDDTGVHALRFQDQ